MLQIRKIQKDEELNKEKINQACLKERNLLNSIVPEKQFLDYAVINNHVYASYRNHTLYKYHIKSINDLADVNLWIPSIIKCLGMILINIVRIEKLTSNEEQFILDLMGNSQYKDLKFIIMQNYRFFSPSLQRKLRIYFITS